jgi:hypothetical protein
MNNTQQPQDKGQSEKKFDRPEQNPRKDKNNPDRDTNKGSC